MNKKLYKKLLSFRSHSQSRMQIYFRDWLQSYIEAHYENVVTKIDDYGNLYVYKSTDASYDYVNCVVAHLDINQKVYTNNFSILEVGNFIVGIDNNTGLQIGLGHDDKAGVYFALRALKKFDNIKCFFPLNEEVGLLGSKNADDSFFDDVGFLLQLDRRGFSDISHYTNGHTVIEDSTKLELEKLICKYNFNWVNTVSTDIGHLTERYGIQGTNMSCAYKDEHTNTEILHVLRYMTSERLGLEILKKTDNKFYPLSLPQKTTTSSTTTTSSSTTAPAATNTSQRTNTTNTSTSSSNNTNSTITKSTNANTTVPVIKDSEKKKITELETPVDDIEYSINMLESMFPMTFPEADDYVKVVEEIYGAICLLNASSETDELMCRLYNVARESLYGLDGYGNGPIMTKLSKIWYDINGFDYEDETYGTTF